MKRALFTKGYRSHGGRKESALDVFDIIAFLVFITGIAGIIRFFVFMPYTVEGSSMASTFIDKDFIVVDKITPKHGTLHRGDIVVFVPPGKDIPFIKRIIGLPGDIVRLVGGKVFICSEEEQNIDTCTRLEEPYLDQGISTNPVGGISTFTVTEGYLVFGDNRPFSTDSRKCFGTCLEGSTYLITKDRIIGKVFMRLVPTPKFFTNENEQYTIDI